MSFIRKIWQFILPPVFWRLPVLLVLGLSFGIGCYIFYESRAWSYLTDDPSACINCHIMMPQYVTWQHSSHARVASCNDCHVPHTSALEKYYFKAHDGLRHATLYTLRLEAQAIKITPPSEGVVQQNCIRCHSVLNDAVHTKVSQNQIQHGEGRYCWDCHREVPHGRVRSLSSTPNSLMLLESSKIPDWLKPRGNP